LFSGLIPGATGPQCHRATEHTNARFWNMMSSGIEIWTLELRQSEEKVLSSVIWSSAYLW